VGAIQGVAAGAPSPAFRAACSTGGSTTGSWRGAHVDDVTFRWGWPPLTQYSFGAEVPANPKPPAGRVSTPTPTSPSGQNPVIVTVTFFLGGVEQGATQVSCT
jgi:hypothetical protein